MTERAEDDICEECGEYEHDCECHQEPEPQQGDWITNDYRTFWEHDGKGRFTVPDSDDDAWLRAVKDRMDRDHFWPTVWFVSDHGNYHLLRLRDG